MSGSKSDTTWIQEIFQGTLTNETRCLNCETVRFFLVICFTSDFFTFQFYSKKCKFLELKIEHRFFILNELIYFHINNDLFSNE